MPKKFMKVGHYPVDMRLMNYFKFIFKKEVQEETSRLQAMEIRRTLIKLLDYKAIELDLQDFNLSPTIADEIIAELAVELGLEVFLKRIKIVNATETQKALI